MSVYKKKNGKWYCRFQIDGERHNYLCAGATNLQEAVKVENGLKYKVQQQQNGLAPIENKLKLIEVYNAYLRYSEINKKTYDRDKTRIRIIKDIWKNKLYAKDIKPIDIEKLKFVLLSMGRSKSTVNKYLQIISKMYNIAIANGLIDYNPMKHATKFKIKHNQIRYLQPDEEIRLFKNADTLWRGILLVALNTGLRLTNIRLLQWKNINLEFRILEFTENKTNKHIKLFMNDVLYDYFNGRQAEPNDYVFTIDDMPMTMNKFQKEWEKLKKKSNIVNLRFHDLRHTVGTRLAKNGVPVNVIKEVMAHSDVSTTMRYVHFANEQIQNALNSLVINS